MKCDCYSWFGLNQFSQCKKKLLMATDVHVRSWVHLYFIRGYARPKKAQVKSEENVC